MSRQILKKVYVNNNPEYAKKEGFVTVGLNSIIDKIWLVEISGEEYYSYKGMGVDFGRDIAETETKYVTQCIINSGVETISCNSPIKPSHLLRAIEALVDNKIEPDILLMNVKDHIQLWYYPNLSKKGHLCIPSEFSGLKNDIKIEFFRLLPEGTSLIADSQSLGTLFTKERIEDTTIVQDIPESEYKKIISEIPALNPSQLPEKARVRSYEVIKVGIANPKAALVIKVKNPEE